LSSVPQISPLEGTVHLTLNGHSESQVTHRGFLTMFHDVSGSGAWKRWWMLLEGSSLSYWTYPDDEAKKEPVGWIDLAKCSTELVSLAPRDICSRAHTFMMETEKPATREDKESLVVIKVSREKTKRRRKRNAGTSCRLIQGLRDSRGATCSQGPWTTCGPGTLRGQAERPAMTAWTQSAKPARNQLRSGEDTGISKPSSDPNDDFWRD